MIFKSSAKSLSRIWIGYLFGKAINLINFIKFDFLWETSVILTLDHTEYKVHGKLHASYGHQQEHDTSAGARDFGALWIEVEVEFSYLVFISSIIDYFVTFGDDIYLLFLSTIESSTKISIRIMKIYALDAVVNSNEVLEGTSKIRLWVKEYLLSLSDYYRVCAIHVPI